MPVTPYRTNLFQDRKELHQLLLTGKQQSLVKGCPQIVSISEEIESLDPLAVLQAIAKPDQLQMYFEKASKREAIAAIDATLCLKLEGTNRFKKHNNLSKQHWIISSPVGNLNLPFSGPHFFCSFTFFDKKQAVHSPFPAATIFLPRWQISCVQGSCVVVANVEINPQTNLQLLVERLCNQLRRISWYERRVSKYFRDCPLTK
jgi:menaquinone-specific isochorismate synthase